MLRDLRACGLKPWRCTIADGHLGIWTVLGEQQPTAAEQRCWNHRITNVLDAIPQKYQADAQTLLCAMPYAETQAACEQLRAQFDTRYCQLAPKAVERLGHDWERLTTFYQFPREHCRHLRTRKVVESPFAAVRLRTMAAKRFKKVDSATAMIWKVLEVAEKTFLRLNALELLPAVYAGAKYMDGNQTAHCQPPGGCRPIPFTHLLVIPLQTHQITLVTTLVDAELYSIEALPQLYSVRWGIETNCAHLKTTVGLDVLKCKTVDGVLKELMVCALIYNLVRLVMGQAAQRQRVAIARISFVDALRWLTAARDNELLITLVNPHRPYRYEPRVRKRRPKPYPLMQNAPLELRKSLV